MDIARSSIICTSNHTRPPIHLVCASSLCDLQGRQGNDIDSAFGLSSGSVHGAAASALVFADAEQNEELEQGDEPQIVERTGEDCGARNSP